MTCHLYHPETDSLSGGDRPSDVLAQAKVRKEQGFTRVKMNVSDPPSVLVKDSC